MHFPSRLNSGGSIEEPPKQMEKHMSKIVLRAAGTAALLVLGTATFTGTALANDSDNANAVGCSASNSQNGNLVPVDAILGNAVNGNNVLSNCPSSATAH
jgi:hypothetical protein